jgi:hypothetical protein
MNDDIIPELIAATLRLRDDPLWLSLLTENLMWASCERFVQCSVLGAFNLASQQYVAARESVFRWGASKVQPDLSLIRPTAYSDWWNSTLSGRPQMVTGVVQLTMVWTEGNAGGSAIVTQKAPKIARDADGLSRFAAAHPGCRAYVGVLTSGAHVPDEGRAALDSADALIKEHLAAQIIAVEHEERIDLLANRLLDHWAGWPRHSSAAGIWAEMCWFRIAARAA